MSAPIHYDIRCRTCKYDGLAPLTHDDTRGWYVTCPCGDEWSVPVPPPISGEGEPC